VPPTQEIEVAAKSIANREPPTASPVWRTLPSDQSWINLICKLPQGEFPKQLGELYSSQIQNPHGLRNEWLGKRAGFTRILTGMALPTPRVAAT
jgi:hypothetical protein